MYLTRQVFTPTFVFVNKQYMMYYQFFYSRFLLSGLLVCLVFGLNAQAVWPGDANNNGVVNGVDVLYIGWAFGATGPARSNISTDWEAQTAPAPWSNTFPDGLNFYFADANGDGVVDENDVEDAVEDNFGLLQGVLTTDGYANAPSNSLAPALSLVPLVDVLQMGEVARFNLSLGSDEMPIQNFHGLALKASVRTVNGSLLDDLDFDHDPLEDLWLAQGDDNFLDFDMTEENDPNKIEVALSRTDRQGVSGSGLLGQFSVIIEDIVVGLPTDTLIIQIDSIRLVSSTGFQTIAVKPTTARVMLGEKVSSTAASPFSGAALPLQVYPNPTRINSVSLNIASNELKTLQLITTDGRVMSPAWYFQSQQRVGVSLPFLAPGIYFLRAYTAEGIRSCKLSIIP